MSEITLPAKTQGRTLDCPFDFRHRVCRVALKCVVANCATGLRWLWWPRVRARWRFNTTTLRAGSPWWSSGTATRDKRAPPRGRPCRGTAGTNLRTGRRYFSITVGNHEFFLDFRRLRVRGRAFLLAWGLVFPFWAPLGCLLRTPGFLHFLSFARLECSASSPRCCSRQFSAALIEQSNSGDISLNVPGRVCQAVSVVTSD